VMLSQELPEPGRLSHAVSNSPVLCLNTRAGDNRLSLTTRRSSCHRGRRHSLR
jgi:hypothetical protein